MPATARKTPTVLAPEAIELLARLAPIEGYNLTGLDDIRLLRSDRPLTRTPVLYEPGIVIVCQGRKRGYLGDQVYIYDPQHYLVVSLALPFSMETEASAAEPLLALYLRLDFNLATDLMLQLDALAQLPNAAPRGMASTPLDARMADSVLRLLRALASPLETRLLGPALVREIYLHVMLGEQGGSMRAALAAHGQFGKIGRAIQLIHQSFAQPLDVPSLAASAGMSVATFHVHFKAVTDSSPMQYLKSTRLHQARLLMARNGMTAGAASAQVGYESASQFGREFKRLFGRSPLQEVARMKQSFALPDPAPSRGFVSSH